MACRTIEVAVVPFGCFVILNSSATKKNKKRLWLNGFDVIKNGEAKRDQCSHVIRFLARGRPVSTALCQHLNLFFNSNAFLGNVSSLALKIPGGGIQWMLQSELKC